MENILHHFQGTHLSSYDPPLDLEHRFAIYDHYEVYDPSKQYEEGEYQFDYGKGMLTYVNHLHKLRTRLNYNNSINVVVAEEVYDEAELKDLVKYCRCSICNAYWFNPVKYLSCPCCVGCIRAALDGFPSIYVIREARLLRDQDN